MSRPSAAEKAKIITRQIEALELRRRGLSYRAIGERLGVSYMQAHRDVNDELKRLAAERDTDLIAEREIDLVRIDHILDRLDVWVKAGNPQSITAYLRAMERRAKLLGLDAPTKQDIHIDDWRSELVDLLKTGKISPDEVVKELGTDLATELFKSAGIRVTSG